MVWSEGLYDVKRVLFIKDICTSPIMPQSISPCLVEIASNVLG